jgi:hypothetical protein
MFLLRIEMIGVVLIGQIELRFPTIHQELLPLGNKK